MFNYTNDEMKLEIICAPPSPRVDLDRLWMIEDGHEDAGGDRFRIGSLRSHETK